MNPIPQLSVLGCGLIGGSVCGAAKTRRAATTVVAWDTAGDAARRAVDLGFADRAAQSLEDAIEGASLIVLATPVDSILELLPQIARFVSPGAVVTDVGSVKTPIALAGKRHLGTRFVASHPMAGAETHGIDSARVDLFVGAAWPITPTRTTDPGAVSLVESFVTALGARPLRLTPGEHDRAVALTSHAPHLIAYALNAVARDRQASGETVDELAAGGFHSATRVAASSPALWAQICGQNQAHVLGAVDEFLAELSRLRETLASGDRAALETALARGEKRRNA